METKAALGSRAWFELLCQHLDRLAARDGVPNATFSFCEVWTDAPPDAVGITSGDRAGWHVRIAGTTCETQPGEVEDVDVKFVMDYQAILPYARSSMADAPKGPLPVTVAKGDARRLPGFFGELHDALAAVTA